MHLSFILIESRGLQTDKFIVFFYNRDNMKTLSFLLFNKKLTINSVYYNLFNNLNYYYFEEYVDIGFKILSKIRRSQGISVDLDLKAKQDQRNWRVLQNSNLKTNNHCSGSLLGYSRNLIVLSENVKKKFDWIFYNSQKYI